MINYLFVFLFILMVSVYLSGCATKFDYTAYRAHKPRSILVLPPKNESSIVEAPYVYLSTITRPLAECGYYVFPVALIDEIFKENGFPTPADMHSIPLEKIKEVFGADAVLYVTIENWGQKYMVIQSMTVVKGRATLADADSGSILWKGKLEAAQGSGGSDPLSMLVAAALIQVIESLVDNTYPLARQANYKMISNPDNGLLAGPYYPGNQKDDHCLLRKVWR